MTNRTHAQYFQEILPIKVQSTCLFCKREEETLFQLPTAETCGLIFFCKICQMTYPFSVVKTNIGLEFFHESAIWGLLLTGILLTQKRVTMVIPKSKLPLIVILAH